MNLANKLTIARLGLTVLFVIFLNLPSPLYGAALAAFLIASITDYLDGYIARKYDMITDFGKLMDPLVDKVLTAAAFISLVALGVFPAWAATVMIAREFLITGLRLLASSKGRILPAEKIGKHKTAWQIIVIIYLLCLLVVMDQGRDTHIFGADLWDIIHNQVSLILTLVAVGLTAWSGVTYVYKNRDIITEH